MNLNEFLRKEGYSDLEEFLEEYMSEGCVPAFCTNEGCSFQSEYEPDAQGIICPNCGAPTVESALVSIGII